MILEGTNLCGIISAKLWVSIKITLAKNDFYIKSVKRTIEKCKNFGKKSEEVLSTAIISSVNVPIQYPNTYRKHNF